MKRARILCHVIGFFGFGGVVGIAGALQIENSKLLCFLALPFTIILAISALLNWKLPPEDKAPVISLSTSILHPYPDLLFITFSQVALFFGAHVEKTDFTEHLMQFLTILFICAILLTTFYLLRCSADEKRK